MSADTSSHLDLDDHIIRFADLGTRKSSFVPIDMFLPRFHRERYAVIGRGAEGTTKGKKTADVQGFSVVYLKIEPGKAIGSHAHDTSEVFIPLTGQWEADVEGQKTTLAPFDVISVPPKAFHGIVNIGSETALIMTINSGTAGAPIHWDPALLDEIKAAGGPVRATDYPPRGMPAE